MVPTVARKRVKTNRLEAQAGGGAAGRALSGIHVPHRVIASCVTGAVARHAGGPIAGQQCRIKSLLLYEGIPFPAANGNGRGRRCVSWSVACNATVRFKLDQLIDALQFHFLAAAKVQNKSVFLSKRS